MGLLLAGCGATTDAVNGDAAMEAATDSGARDTSTSDAQTTDAQATDAAADSGRDSGPPMCMASCTTNMDCLNLCAPVPGAFFCCDPGTNTCFASAAMCGMPPPPRDSGMPPYM